MARVIGILALVAVLVFLQCRGTAADEQNRFFLVQNPVDNMLVSIIKFLDENKVLKCQLFSDQAVVAKVKEITGGDNILYPSVDQMENIWKLCGPSGNAEDQKYALEGARSWDIIFPGTKWCGAGDIAENDDDLGYYADTDRCCRAHDKCNDIMLSGETKNNLTNDGPFTALSCKCDNDFHQCLKDSNSFTSYTVGTSYFSVLRRQCYEERYPVTDTCKTYMTFLQISCSEYELDTSKPKQYQWVSAQYYK